MATAVGGQNRFKDDLENCVNVSLAKFFLEIKTTRKQQMEARRGKNLERWDTANLAFNMRLYLESQDLFEYADGAAESPGNEASANDVRRFRLRAKKAWTFICLAVEPDEQLHIRDTKTAKEAWDALKSQFARDSISQKVRLRQKYYSCRFDNNGNMSEHINYLKSLHDQLREMGVDVNDQELAVTLIDKVEVKRHDDALSARRYFNSRQGNRGRSPNVNHKKPARSGTSQSFNGTCHYCKEQGHYARDCPKKKARSLNGPSNVSVPTNSAHIIEEDSDNQIEDEEALYTGENVVTSNSCWIVDSGATQHMTYEKDSLYDFVTFKQPSIIILGDNRAILAYGKGTYRFTTVVEGKLQKIALHDVLYLPDLGKNLLSVRAMTKLGATVEFEAEKCKIARNSKVPEVSSSSTPFVYPDILTDEKRDDNHDNTQMLDERPTVGETYEERFLREVATLPEKRQSRLPQRFIQEEADYCFTADVLAADIDEPKSINEAWNNKHSVKFKRPVMCPDHLNILEPTGQWMNSSSNSHTPRALWSAEGLHLLVAREYICPGTVLKESHRIRTTDSRQIIETAQAEMAQQLRSLERPLPLLPANELDQVITFFWWDNFDCKKENTVGSLHATHGVAYQEASATSIEQSCSFQIEKSNRRSVTVSRLDLDKRKITRHRNPNLFDGSPAMEIENNNADKLLLLWQLMRRVSSVQQRIARFVGWIVQVFGKPNSEPTRITFLPPISNTKKCITASEIAALKENSA
eukprot:gene1580-1745_t